MQEQRSAFVVWLDEDNPAPETKCTGQVEHVRSATRVNFASADELLRFLADPLRRGTNEEGA